MAVTDVQTSQAGGRTQTAPRGIDIVQPIGMKVQDIQQTVTLLLGTNLNARQQALVESINVDCQGMWHYLPNFQYGYDKFGGSGGLPEPFVGGGTTGSMGVSTAGGSPQQRAALARTPAQRSAAAKKAARTRAAKARGTSVH